jgi:DNA-binding transcriptional LysR family regulator
MKKARKITIPIPGTLDWELLRRFNIITHSQTFGEAAEKIGTSQPALLKQMDDLEEFLGQKLFTTTAKYRSMELTPEGKTLSMIVNKISEILKKQIISNIKTTDEQKSKKVIKLITTAGISTTLLPPILTEFIRHRDDVRIELSVQLSPLKLNVGEVSIRHNFLSQLNIKTVHIQTITMEFYASEKYLKNYGTPLDYNDLIHHKMLAYQYFNISSTDHHAYTHGKIIYLEPVIQSDYIGFLVEMALKDQGIIELPDIHPGTGKLKKISTIPSQKLDVYAGFLDIAEQEPIIYELIEFLTKTKGGDENDKSTK